MIEHKIFSCERFMTSSLAFRLSFENYKAASTEPLGRSCHYHLGSGISNISYRNDVFMIRHFE